MGIRNRSVDRRDFLKQLRRLDTCPYVCGRSVSHQRSTFGRLPLAANVWVTISTDGTISIMSPAAEMGQGSFTTLPIIVADEMDADWSKVRPIRPTSFVDKKLGNPAYGGNFQTSASASVNGYFKGLRIAGAQARRVLLDAASQKWGVPIGELSTEPSVVVHKASGRRMSYGEIASFATVPAELPVISDEISRRRLTSATSARMSRAWSYPSRSQVKRSTELMCRCRAWSMPRCCSVPTLEAVPIRWTIRLPAMETSPGSCGFQRALP